MCGSLFCLFSCTVERTHMHAGEAIHTPANGVMSDLQVKVMQQEAQHS